MGKILNEKQWRQFLALEAKEKGEVAAIALEAGVSKILCTEELMKLKVETRIGQERMVGIF